MTVLPTRLGPINTTARRTSRSLTERRACLDALLDFGLQGFLFPVLNHDRLHLAAALDEAYHGSLIFSTDFAAHLLKRTHSQSAADAMIHEPRRLLRDADSPMDFIRTDTVLAVHNLPHRGEPLG